MLEDLEAALDIGNQKPNDYWIVVNVELSKKELVHAHSRRDIFKQRP
ncbi:hypothetical protein SAMN05216601_110205 [Ectopseudomonas composti]|uniref:Uncharacterized protein n=2 Tax=Ectopseudomonas composti TaxID=658457 RepID=A0A1I5Q0Q8_9GAMM|nr:hypothetical protein SAMN05216601_110205 [Pseudomonas composti]